MQEIVDSARSQAGHRELQEIIYSYWQKSNTHTQTKPSLGRQNAVHLPVYSYIVNCLGG